jgi:hypothetical protein
MEIVNIFGDDAFSAASMTEAVNTIETLPREIMSENLFTYEPVRTRTIGFEMKNGVLRFAPVDQVGDPIKSTTRGKGRLKYFDTVRVAVKDQIRAASLEFVNQFGGDSSKIIEGVQEVITKRQTDEEGLIAQHDNTIERMYLGAIDGKWTDDQGEVIIDWFTEFGIARPPVISLALATKSEGDLRLAIESSIIRPMKRAAKGMPFSGVSARMGEEAWDLLNKNPEIREAYVQQGNVAALHGKTLGQELNFAGVTWREYFGDDNGAVALAPDEIRFYPTGGRGIFKHFLSPGEGFADLGLKGEPMYSYQELEKSSNPSFVDLFVMSYPGIFVSRPEMLRSGSSNA